MILKDIIRSACTFLDDKEVADYLGGNAVGNADILKRVNTYANLCNLTITELAAGYIPMTTAENVSLSEGKANFSDLTFGVTRIIGVKTIDGDDISFKLFPTYIKTDKNLASCVIEYEYAPPNYGLTDTVGFKKTVSATLMAYGLCAEFCVKEGRFEEAVMWRKRYIDGVERIIMPKNSQTALRCWL